jgi:hypothetical protein
MKEEQQSSMSGEAIRATLKNKEQQRSEVGTITK